MTDALPPQMYQAETAAFLRRFARNDQGRTPDEQMPELVADVTKVFNAQLDRLGKLKRGDVTQDDLTALERDYGMLHPATIAERMARIKFNNIPAEEQKFAEILGRIYPRDPTTDFYAKQTMPVIVGLAHLCAQQTNEDVCLVEGDFTNMAGCNTHFMGKAFDSIRKKADGRDLTDKLLHEISSIVRDAFKEHAKEVHEVRAGGDEERLVVYGLKKEEVQKILTEKVNPAINLLAAKYGVHDILHTKTDKLPGFGASFACVDLKKMTDPSAIKDEIDTLVALRKFEDAWLRHGVIGDENLTSYVMKVTRAALIEKGHEDGPELAALINAKIPEFLNTSRLVEKEWEALKRDGIYSELAGPGKPFESATPDEFFDKVAKANEKNVIHDLKSITVPPPAKTKIRVPFSDVPVSDHALEDPDTLRLRKAMKAFGFDAAAEMQDGQVKWNRTRGRLTLARELREPNPRNRQLQNQILYLMDEFHAPDPTTRCKSNSLLAENAEIYLAKSKEMRVLQFEVTNLSGLNKIDHPLAEAVLRETGKQIRTALKANPSAAGDDVAAHMADYLHYDDNGRFKALVPVDYLNKVPKLEQDLNRLIQDNILGKTVTDFAKETYARPFTVSGPVTDEQQAAIDARAQQSGAMLETLSRHVAEIEKDKGVKISTIGDIPPSRKNGSAVGLLVNGDSVIKEGEPLHQALERVTIEAANAAGKAKIAL